MKNCHWCGRMTHSANRVCQGCITVDRRQPGGYSPDDGLKGGRWVLSPRRILVWEPEVAA